MSRLLAYVLLSCHNSYNSTRFVLYITRLLLYTGIHFSATGINNYSDLCGKLEFKLLQNEASGGFHGSKLTLDFRSNRIYHKGDFNLGIVCIPSSAMAQKNSGYGNRYSVQDCSSSQTLRSKRSANRPTTTKEFFVRYS